MNSTKSALLPASVRRWVVGVAGALLLVAAVLIVWRGPAILLDLSALGAWLGCF